MPADVILRLPLSLAIYMVEGYKIITVTHKSADLKDIGSYVLPNDGEESVHSRLRRFKNRMGIDGLMYLATCNRVTYFFHSSSFLDQSFLNSFTRFFYPDSDTLTASNNYLVFQGEPALRHLFEVASSVDSLVVGEREIIRQLREAYGVCRKEGLTGDKIRLAMDATVRTAKQVYGGTRIGEKQVSVVSLAVKKLLDAQLPNDARILMVGAGQTNALFTKFLVKYGYSNVSVYNRTLEKAQALADSLGGQAFPLSRLHEHQGGFDALVVCTSSTGPVINSESYPLLLAGETDSKIVLDLSIPNDVSVDVVADYDFEYIDIESLKALANENLKFRSTQVHKAKAMVELALEEFRSLYLEREVEVAMRAVPEQIKQVKSKAMNEVFRKELDELDEPTKELLDRMMTYMEKKCIGIPMKAAKKAILD